MAQLQLQEITRELLLILYIVVIFIGKQNFIVPVLFQKTLLCLYYFKNINLKFNLYLNKIKIINLEF